MTPKELAEHLPVSQESIITNIRNWELGRFGVNDKIEEPVLRRALTNFAEKARSNDTQLAAMKLLRTLPPAKLNGYHAIPEPKGGKEETPIPKVEIQNPIANFLKGNIPDQLDIINLVEMVLVTIGLFLLYNIPGIALAVMVCLFMWKAQSTAKNPELRDANRNGIAVITAMAVFSSLLHFITFYTVMPDVDIIHPIMKNGRLATNQYEEIDTLIKVIGAAIPAIFTSVLNVHAITMTNKIAKQK